MPKLSQFLFGRNEKNKQKSLLTPEQQKIENQLINASMNRGTGGAFGESADYYRDVLSRDPYIQQQFEAPEMNRFYGEIVPGLAEQFGGIGGLSGSSFRNAATHQGQSLSERLRAIRAGLRENAASNLSQMGQFALQPRVENIHRPETGGFVQSLAKGVGIGLGSGIGTLGGQQYQRGISPTYNTQQQVQNSIYGNSQSAIAPTSAISNPIAWRR